MPRRERLLEAHNPVEAFAVQLRSTKREAGVTYRTMAEKTHFSHAHFVRAASGKALPSWPVTEAFLRACGTVGAEALKAWEQYWAATDAVAARPSARSRRRRRGITNLTTPREFGLLLQDMANQPRHRSLRVLEAETDIGKSTLSGWFSGQRIPNVSVLTQFAIRLGSTSEQVDQLLEARSRVVRKAKRGGVGEGSELQQSLADVLRSGGGDDVTEAAREITSALAKAEERRIGRHLMASAHEVQHDPFGLPVWDPREARAHEPHITARVSGRPAERPAKAGRAGRRRLAESAQLTDAAQSRAAYEIERLRAATLADALQPTQSPKHQAADRAIAAVKSSAAVGGTSLTLSKLTERLAEVISQHMMEIFGEEQSAEVTRASAQAMLKSMREVVGPDLTPTALEFVSAGPSTDNEGGRQIQLAVVLDERPWTALGFEPASCTTVELRSKTYPPFSVPGSNPQVTATD